MTRRFCPWRSHRSPWIPLALAALLSPPLAADEPPGVVVEEVTPGFAAAQAGLAPGDVLLRWERAANPPANPDPASGDITHPFDLWVVEIEQEPRGEVTLLGERDGEALAAALPPRRWRLTTRPQLSAEELEVYERARKMAGSEDAEGARGALAAWRHLVERWQSDGSSQASWLLFKMARLEAKHELDELGTATFKAAASSVNGRERPAWLAELYRQWGTTLEHKHRWDQAEESYRAALASQNGESLLLARTLRNLGVEREHRGDLTDAESYFTRSLVISERLAPRSQAVSASLTDLGNVAWYRGALSSAGEYYRRALTIREELIPNSLDVATILNALGNVARRSGDSAAAEGYYQRSLAIREQLAPDSLDFAVSLNSLGMLAWVRGDLSAAAGYYERSLAIQERLAPESLHTAASLVNLSNVLSYRGDLSTAEDYARRALAIQERLAPDGRDMAISLNNLATLMQLRGDLQNADDYLRRSLRIQEKLAAESLEVATILINLGFNMQRRGNLNEAEEYLRRSLAITEKRAPESLDVAASLRTLGDLMEERGDSSAAERYYQRALTIRRRLAPGSLDVAITLSGLGLVARDRGDLETAAELLRQSLDLRSLMATDSLGEAETLHALADVRWRLRQPVEALELSRRALTALESQAGTLGGGRESRGNFLAQYGGYYRDTIDLLLEQDHPAEAFHILERSRVRGLLALLAERDLLFTADLPEALRRERQEANTENDRILNKLGDWTSLQENADATKKELLEKLAAVRQHQAEIEAKIRAASPRLAALQYPEPLTLAQTQAALDPGTVLLAYSLGEEKSHLFVVGKGSDDFAVIPLAITREEARERVEELRQVWKAVARRSAELRQRTSELSERLLGPAGTLIAAAERLVILPDGPLHYLPFAALQDPTSGERFRYLIEAKPVSVVGSATLLAELKKDRKPPSTESKVVAFADPLYPQVTSEEKTEEPVLRVMARDGFALPPLPGTRAEAAALGRLYPESSTLYLGPEAKEETAKAAAKDAAILHFACHGLVDDRQPLSSALALSIPAPWHAGEDNGLLQAWEIFEQLRLDADLVTLSACDTALGKESAGEGLLGLTRAFQYAGARSVLASLWAVADESTAALMERFYGHLRAGMSKDQALRHAQLELLAGPIEVTVAGDPTSLDASQPFFWAPFELIGDWR